MRNHPGVFKRFCQWTYVDPCGISPFLLHLQEFYAKAARATVPRFLPGTGGVGSEVSSGVSLQPVLGMIEGQ